MVEIRMAMAMDLVIRNGTIVDGNGGAAFVGDVGVKDGLIVQVGDLADVVGVEEIDATGKHVMPGVCSALPMFLFVCPRTRSALPPLGASFLCRPCLCGLL